MNFLNNLKSIFKIKFDLSKLSSIHLLSDNKNSQTINIVKKTININIGSVSPDLIPKLQNAIKKAVQQEDDLLIEDDANKLLIDISKVTQNKENTGLVQFFRGKINSKDLEILRAALYIKNVYERGSRIGDLKDDLIIKYGDRGRNIVNLCSAGYFDTLIKPLYNHMITEPNFTPERFLDTFDKIITYSPFAIFVSSPMDSKELLLAVETRMELNKKYGINYINIHGIGEHNVSKIEELLKSLKDKLIKTPDVEIGRGYITVTIYF